MHKATLIAALAALAVTISSTASAQTGATVIDKQPGKVGMVRP